MKNIIKKLLLDIVNDLDTGNSDINEEEELKIMDLLTEYTIKDRKLSKYQACKLLNVSRATFDNYVKDGKIPAGRHQQGFKELF